jgi:hypothetical protein
LDSCFRLGGKEPLFEIVGANYLASRSARSGVALRLRGFCSRANWLDKKKAREKAIFFVDCQLDGRGDEGPPGLLFVLHDKNT